MKGSLPPRGAQDDLYLTVSCLGLVTAVACRWLVACGPKPHERLSVQFGRVSDCQRRGVWLATARSSLALSIHSPLHRHPQCLSRLIFISFVHLRPRLPEPMTLPSIHISHAVHIPRNLPNAWIPSKSNDDIVQSTVLPLGNVMVIHAHDDLA